MTPEPGRISQREFLDSIEGVFTERTLWVDGLWMIGVLVGLAGVFVVAYWIQRRSWANRVNNPRKLFRSVLRGLKLPVPQNDAIIRICRESGVEHPISLLICRDLFRRHASTWMDNLERTHGSSARRNAASRVFKAEAALFSWIDQPGGLEESTSVPVSKAAALAATTV